MRKSRSPASLRHLFDNISPENNLCAKKKMLNMEKSVQMSDFTPKAV